MADLVIGIDIGGTKIAAGLLDLQGNILGRGYSHSHAGYPPGQVVEAVIQTVRSLMASAGVTEDQIAGVGVGSAGHIDFERGIVLTHSDLPAWNCHPLRDTLKDRFGLPVVLDNDANCAAWGEYRYGTGRSSRHMGYIMFNTGCGMGIIIDDRLYCGATGTAGEIGHMVVNADGPLCSCGKRGCLMSYACGMALDQMARDCLECGEETLLREICGDCPDKIQAEQIAEAIIRGDPVALRLLTMAGQNFGIGLSTVVQGSSRGRL